MSFESEKRWEYQRRLQKATWELLPVVSGTFPAGAWGFNSDAEMSRLIIKRAETLAGAFLRHFDDHPPHEKQIAQALEVLQDGRTSFESRVHLAREFLGDLWPTQDRFPKQEEAK